MTLRPAPKPPRREKRPRGFNSSLPRPSKTLPKESVAGVASRGRKGTANSPLRKTTMRKRPKSAEKFAYQYGSEARVAFVKSLPCVACGLVGAASNAHVGRRSGMGRKGPYTEIAPLCEFTSDHGTYGCHRRLHNLGHAAFERCHKIDLNECAARTEAAWQSHLADKESM